MCWDFADKNVDDVQNGNLIHRHKHPKAIIIISAASTSKQIFEGHASQALLNGVKNASSTLAQEYQGT